MKARHLLNKIRFYSVFLLLAFYIGVGLVFIFTDIWADLLPKSRFLIGIILILWGILRFYVAYKRYLSKAMRLHQLSKREDVKTE